MTLQQLQYIVALDEYRHFVRAAEKCFVAQPTLTLQVKKLEEEIGISLFNRSSQPLVPTPAGEAFIIKAREIINSIDKLKEMVNERKQKMEGQFSLGIIPTLAPYLLPRFIKSFCDAHPKIHLEIKEMQSHQILQALKTNQLQLGIMVTPTEDNAIRELLLFHEPFLLYANSDHYLLKKEKLLPEDVKGKDLWVLNEGHCFRNQVLNICDGNTGNPQKGLTFESGSIETIKNMIRSNPGFSLVPELSVDPKLDKGCIRRFSEPQPIREVSIVTHTSFIHELLLAHLRDSITESIPENMKKNKAHMTIKWR